MRGEFASGSVCLAISRRWPFALVRRDVHREQNPVNAAQAPGAVHDANVCDGGWLITRARCRLTQIFSRRVIADKGDLHAQLAAACPASRFIYSKHTHAAVESSELSRLIYGAESCSLQTCHE